MNGSRSEVKNQALLRNHRVETVVLRPGCLRVKHNVSHSGVLVSQEVAQNIDRPLIEVAISILRVSTLLVSVHCPVHKVDYFVFYFDHIDSLRIEVERHMLVTLDIHECTIYSE